MYELLDEMHAWAERTKQPVGILFEEAVKKTYQAYLSSGDKAIDIGAHKGAHLIPMAESVGRNGQIIAFEPIPKLCQQLSKTIKKKRLKQIKLHNVAVGLEKGTTTFSYFENKPAYSGLQRRATPFDDKEGGLTEITVNTAPLDHFRPFWGSVKFIKLDIEGGELHALQSGKRMLQKSRPMIVFENGKSQSAKIYNYEKEDFFSFFESLDYQLYVITGEPFTRDDWQKHIKCWEYVGLPKENAIFAERLPQLSQAVLSEALT